MRKEVRKERRVLKGVKATRVNQGLILGDW